MMRRTFAACGLGIFFAVAAARADETCMSPYLPKITGQEDYVYVWTLGIEGVGDGSDKLVTIGANPKNGTTFGKVISKTSVGGRFEAHHGDFDDARRHFWVSGLDDRSKIFATSRGRKPEARPHHRHLVKDSGGVMARIPSSRPGQMLITGLSNATDRGGRTGRRVQQCRRLRRTIWMPKDAEYVRRAGAVAGETADLSFTGATNHTRLREMPLTRKR
jgi:selenium-binding protein 1